MTNVVALLFLFKQEKRKKRYWESEGWKYTYEMGKRTKNPMAKVKRRKISARSTVDFVCLKHVGLNSCLFYLIVSLQPKDGGHGQESCRGCQPITLEDWNPISCVVIWFPSKTASKNKKSRSDILVLFYINQPKYYYAQIQFLPPFKVQRKSFSFHKREKLTYITDLAQRIQEGRHSNLTYDHLASNYTSRVFKKPFPRSGDILFREFRDLDP